MSPIFTSSKFGFAAGSAADGEDGWISPAAGDLYPTKTIFESEVSTSSVTFNAGGGTYSMTGGPSGGLYSTTLLAVNSSTGVLSGNFGDDGTYSITATSSIAGNRAFTITVAEDNSGSTTIGSFTMVPNTSELVEKNPTNVIFVGGGDDVLGTKVGFTN